MPLVMSLFGGLAKAASKGFKTWRQFVASLFVSGFAGMVVHLFIQDANISPSMGAALVGLSGYSGVVILDGLAAFAQKILEKITGQDFGKVPSPASMWDGVERRTGTQGGNGADNN